MPVSGSVTSLIPSGGFDSKLFTSLATLASVRGGRFSDDRIAEEDMVVGVGVNPQNNKWKHFAARGLKSKWDGCFFHFGDFSSVE